MRKPFLLAACLTLTPYLAIAASQTQEIRQTLLGGEFSTDGKSRRRAHADALRPC